MRAHTSESPLPELYLLNLSAAAVENAAVVVVAVSSQYKASANWCEALLLLLQCC